jgi:SAM-dependent methyltransferase
MSDLTAVNYVEQELLYNEFMKPAVRSAIASLGLPRGSLGLDAGCGPGGLFGLLCEATGNDGVVVGLDISRPHLLHGRQQAEMGLLQGQVRLAQADLRRSIPFADRTFDWAWSADVLWPDTFENPIAVIRELSRIVKPDGKVAVFLVDWLRSMLLPGYSHLERYLCTAVETRYYMRARHNHQVHHENALMWFQRVGLSNIKVSYHLVQYQYPLDNTVLRYLQGEYGDCIREYALQAGMKESEWEEWLEVSNSRSQKYILHQEEYHCLKFGTLVVGQVPM